MDNLGGFFVDFMTSSEADVAYHVLSEKGQTMYYKDLVLEVIEKKQKPVQSLSAAISEVYTHINMDSRFHYAGEGQWGLMEWAPPETKRAHGAARSVSAGAGKGASKASRRKEKLFESIQE